MKTISNMYGNDFSFLIGIIEDLPVGVLVLDAEGKVLILNSHQQKISKIDPDQVIGTYFHKTWCRLFDEGIYGDHYWNLINKRVPFSIVFHEVSPQFYDNKVTGIAHGAPLSGGKGFVLLHDISDEIRHDKSTLERLANQLQESTEFLSNLIDSSPNAVIVINESGRITFNNETVQNCFGYSRSDLLGQKIEMLFQKPIERKIQKLSDSDSASFEAHCASNTGRAFPVHVQFKRFFNKLRNSEYALFIIRDISVEKKMASTLEERLNFERLLSELSATFVNLPTERIDAKITSGIGRICRFLGVHRGGLFQFSKKDNVPYLSHSWAEPSYEMDLSNITPEGFPYLFEAVNKGEVIRISKPDDIPEEAVEDRKNFMKIKAHSYLGIPLIAGSSNLAQMGFGTMDKELVWTDDLVHRLKLVAEIFANALLRKRSQESLNLAFEEIKTLKDQLEAERNYLRDEIKLEHNFEEIIGNSSAIQYALYKVEQVAPTDATVLINGETGTGKELIARAIHNAGASKDRPLIKVNCATLPANLIESELFGHEKGAFTGASSARAGRFELADKSTIFLDEIGEMPMELQPKLLRVLQDGTFERLGGSRTINVQARVIAATNRNLELEVQNGRFRKDLWYRLNVFPITVPTLRERKEDIPLLVNHFVKRFCKRLGRSIHRIDTQAMNKLKSYDWPGNIRELENIIERMVINCRGNVLYFADEVKSIDSGKIEQDRWKHLDELERDYILRVLKETHWRISGAKGAAVLLGINPNTLRGRMRKLGISRT